MQSMDSVLYTELLIMCFLGIYLRAYEIYYEWYKRRFSKHNYIIQIIVMAIAALYFIYKLVSIVFA